MDAELWARVKALFQSALELPDAERDAHVAAATTDADLLAEVRALLDAERSGRQLVPIDHAELLPSSIGPYRPLRLIGRGGMGVVYLAERVDGGFRQQVAIKAIASSLVGADARLRFERERQILARLSHPHIARLLDGGVDAAGTPYFAMEYIDGEALDRCCDRRRLDLRARLRLLLEVMDAVDFAHRNLIVHRDLKPSNILVEQGRAKLLDFGIARLLDVDADGDATRSGTRALTPDYAAPEQLAGDVISTATDVYGLGLLMYELLCGRLPFRASSVDRRRYADAVLREEPQRMRDALLRRIDPNDRRNTTPAALAEQRSTTLPLLQRELDGELDAIVATALAKAPAERFPSVAAMADDVRAFLDDRPLACRAASRRRRVVKFIRRHRYGVGVAAALLLTAGVGVGATVWQAAEARRQAERAEREAATAVAVRRTLTGLFSAADPESNGGAEPTVREALDRGVDQVDLELAAQPMARTALLSDAGAVYSSLGQYERAVAVLQRAVGDDTVPTDVEQVVAVRRRAEALIELADFDRAALLLGRLAPFVAQLDPLDPVAVDVELAGISLDRERDHKAAAHARAEQLVARLQSARPPQPRLLAEALDQQAQLLMSERREADAVAPLQQARALLASAGAGPTELARADGQLARALVSSGRIDEGTALLRATMAEQERVLGAEHFITLRTLNDLAMALQKHGDHAEARALFTRLVDARRRRLGAEHPITAVAYNNLGVLDYADKRYAEAAASFAQARRIWLARLGPQHDYSLSASANLAGSDAEIGRVDEALVLLDEVVAARRQRGDDHVLYSALLTRGLARERAGRDADALADFRESRAIGERVWAQDYSQWTWSDTLLGRALRRSGATAEAAQSLERAVAEYGLPRYLPGSLRKATACFELATLLRDRHGDAARILELATASVEIRRRILGDTHPETQAALALQAAFPNH